MDYSEVIKMAVELTDDDIKNGWTIETLTKYHSDREKITMKKISDSRVPDKPQAQRRYNPLRWREE
jgi:hypothetical protein